MKIIKVILTVVFVLTVSLTAVAQCNMSSMSETKDLKAATVKTKLPTNAQTTQIKVSGNCESCKTRIEKAAIKAGAIKADWSANTQILTVSFDPKKTSEDKISKQVAAAGHDNEKYKATDKTYNALPGCCKYERKK